MPTFKSINVGVISDELAVPGLDQGRSPEAGVGDAGDCLRAIVHHAEGAKSVEDAKLVLGGDGKADVWPEVVLEPGFEVRSHGLRVPVVGDEVYSNPPFLQPTQHPGRSSVGLSFADAIRGESVSVNLHRRLLTVGVEDVGPSGTCLRVQPLTRYLNDSLAHPGGEVPDGRVYIHAEDGPHPSEPFVEIHSLAPVSGGSSAPKVS